jgi:hypothetical protein
LPFLQRSKKRALPAEKTRGDAKPANDFTDNKELIDFVSQNAALQCCKRHVLRQSLTNQSSRLMVFIEGLAPS